MPSSAPMATTMNAPEKGAFRFLDLPGELRNHIYSFILPDHGQVPIDPEEPLREDEETSCTNIMATCHQIYDEAWSLLYGSKEFQVDIPHTGCILFLNQVVKNRDILTTNLTPLNNIEVLQINISELASRHWVCEMQNMLFAFLSHLDKKNKLHTLEVNIDVSMLDEKDNDFPVDHPRPSSWSADRTKMQNIMHEIHDTTPGELSRMHLVAFLTDPLRTIRGFGDENTDGKLTLNFVGNTENPWNQLEGNIRHLIKSDGAVPNYELFDPYYSAFGTLLMKTFDLDIYAFDQLDDIEMRCTEATEQLTEARIRADIKSFRQGHNAFVAANNIILEMEFALNQRWSHPYLDSLFQDDPEDLLWDAHRNIRKYGNEMVERREQNVHEIYLPHARTRDSTTRSRR